MYTIKLLDISQTIKLAILTLAAVTLVSCETTGGGAGPATTGGTTTPPPIVTPPPPPIITPPPPPLAQCEATRTRVSRDVLSPAESRSLEAQPKIVGGTETAQDAYPWAAALTFRQTNGSLFQYCGGSLIAPDWVLTAAHCEVQPSDTVVLGRHDLRANDGEEHGIDFVLNHSQYNTSPNNHDIALIKLATPSQLPTISLVDALDTHAQPGHDSTVIGWGKLSEGGQASPTLQEVTIPIVSNQICGNVYSNLTSNMLCAGVSRGGLDSCQGDSGGALMVQNIAEGEWEQAGVVSFGIGCARQNIFGVYTRVSQYVDWVAACQANPAP